MNIPEDLQYTKEHEWVRLDHGLATVGVTDYAQGELGDIVFVELPEVGRELEAMESFGTIEAVKTVSDLYSPVAGTVEEVNRALETQPELVNSDPYGQGWMIRVRVSGVPGSLLSAQAYSRLIEG